MKIFSINLNWFRQFLWFFDISMSQKKLVTSAYKRWYWHIFNFNLKFGLVPPDIWRSNWPPRKNVIRVKTTLFYFLSLVFIRCTTHCHSVSVAVIVGIHCHSLSFVVTRCTTCCHLLYHSLSFVVTCCTTHCHSFSLDVSLVCLFTKDQIKLTVY